MGTLTFALDTAQESGVKKSERRVVVKVRPRPKADLNLYRPKKQSITCRLDADVARWIKQGGKGYQTRLNALLRDLMNDSLSS